MKRGDKVPVNIGNHQVAMAEVKELEDGTVTLVVPATLVVMGVRTELTDLPSTEPAVETIITGVDRASGPVEQPEPSATVRDPDTIVTNSEQANNIASTTETGNAQTDAAQAAPAIVPAPAVTSIAAEPPAPVVEAAAVSTEPVASNE